MFLFRENRIISFDVISILSHAIEHGYFSRMEVSLHRLEKFEKEVRDGLDIQKGIS